MQMRFFEFSTSFQHIIGGIGIIPVIFQMKVSAEFKRSAFAVPGSVIEHLKDADSIELAVLLYALANAEFSLTDAANAIGTDEHEFINAISNWEKRGVLVSERCASKKSRKAKDAGLNAPPPEKVKEKKKRTSQLPSYTTEETAAFLEENKCSAEIIDSCENIIGKIFTTAETNIIIGLLDHLSLSGDYILLLFAHAADIGKKSVRYIEKMALSFFDRGITEYAELEEELAAMAQSEKTEKAVRKIFGIGKRALTEKEERFIRNWGTKYGYGKDIITRAYEITVNNTGDASMDYANAVLENWYKADLTTIEAVDESIAARKAEKKASETNGTLSSFDTEDFFDAALKRSYES